MKAQSAWGLGAMPPAGVGGAHKKIAHKVKNGDFFKFFRFLAHILYGGIMPPIKNGEKTMIYPTGFT